MRRLDRRLVAALTFFLVLAVAGPPWPPVRRGFARAYCAVMNGLLGPLGFGQGGHVHVSPGNQDATGRTLAGEVTTDTVMLMTIEGKRGGATVGLNARRDGYLPLVLLLASVIAAPLGRRARLRCLFAGGLVQGAAMVASLWLFVLWNFTVGLAVRGLYSLTPLQLRAVDVAFRTLLLPPGNRFIFPLLVAAALIGPQLRASPLRPPCGSAVPPPVATRP
jgi:hypothetical protein